jgi:hypothetical protein
MIVNVEGRPFQPASVGYGARLELPEIVNLNTTSPQDILEIPYGLDFLVQYAVLRRPTSVFTGGATTRYSIISSVDGAVLATSLLAGANDLSDYIVARPDIGRVVAGGTGIKAQIKFDVAYGGPCTAKLDLFYYLRLREGFEGASW